MIFNIFGLVDVLAAAMLYFGKIPGPQFLVNLCMAVLLIKGLMSFFPLPKIFPFASPLGLADMITALLLFFGAAPVPGLLKNIVIVVLVVKGVLSTLPELFKFLG